MVAAKDNHVSIQSPDEKPPTYVRPARPRRGPVVLEVLPKCRRHLMEIQPRPDARSSSWMLAFNRRAAASSCSSPLFATTTWLVSALRTGSQRDSAFVPPATASRTLSWDDEGVVVATAVPGEGVTGRGSGPGVDSTVEGAGRSGVGARTWPGATGVSSGRAIASPTPVGTTAATSGAIGRDTLPAGG